MVLDYYPMGSDKTYNFIWNECKHNDERSVEEIIYDLLDDRFCRHIYKKGKNEGKMCLRYIKNNKAMNNKPLCGRHNIVENKKYKKYKPRCLNENCKSYSRVNGYCNRHKLPPLPIPNDEENRFFNDYIYLVKYKPICINMKIFKFYKRFIFKDIVICQKTLSGNTVYYNNIKLELKLINKNNIFWNKIRSVFIFQCIYIKIKKKIKKEVSQNTSNFKNNENLEYYLKNIYYMLENIKDLDLLKKNLLNLLNILSYNMNIKDVYYNTKEIKDSDLQNELHIINKETDSMNISKETTSWGGDIYEFKEFINEYNNNSECNKSNENKKINVLKNDIVKLFKEYSLEMGAYKKSFISLIKDVQETNLNNKLNEKSKYVEIRITEKCYYEHIYEDITLIKNHIKKKNIEKINKIDFNTFISRLLKIIDFFKYDYIYFKNNYN